jgi:hypothetical protein
MSRPKPMPPAPPNMQQLAPDALRLGAAAYTQGAYASYAPGGAAGGEAGGGMSSFAAHVPQWHTESADLGRLPPPPPPEPPGWVLAAANGELAARGGPSPPSTSARVHVLAGHGALAASALAVDSAQLATEAASWTRQTVRSVQNIAGVSAEQVELIGVAIGLAAGLGCVCCMRCACRRPTRQAAGLSRGQRARKALAGMTNRNRARHSHRAVPVDDWDDELDDDDDDDELEGYHVGAYGGYDPRDVHGRR